ncbi:MAG: endopeptidase La [Planctomycetes bacterium]|nr:endopeptidase La [Planctomycetota bacterium]
MASDPKDDAAAPAQEPESKPEPAVTVQGPEGQGTSLTVQEQIPETLFVLPLRRAVPFPNLMMPILVDSPRAREILAKAEANQGYVLLLTQKDPSIEEPGPADFYDTGVIARVLKTLKLPDGNASAMSQGLRRGRIERYVREKPLLLAKVKPVVELPPRGKRAEALFRALQKNLRRVVEVSGTYGNEFATALLNIEQGDQLCDFTGSYFLKNIEDRQRLLDLVDVEQRLEAALEMVMRELEFAELGNRIQEEIRTKAEKAQKDYFLKEQLKIIRRELGEETDARQAEIRRLEEALERAGMPEAAHKRAEEEMARLKTTPSESAEYSVVRNYLDWLTALPWSKSTQDNEDLTQAQRVLDEDHFGLVEVKERILEFLAVRKLKPAQAGSILCFAGPPGVGKTSLGRSIARAMGRRFWRFSLGGMRDEAEIKGHRRTYIGALPGRILQGLKTCASNNPVVMLDEIDKLGADFRGDPSSALLEVLDPEQNSAFLDHYLDVPFDLSRVMFLATANVLPQIPEPLRDRMEVIEIPGYLLEEKVEIARRHLVPKALDRHGLARRQLSFTTPALRRIVELHTREAGVRNLEKMIHKVCRKAALAVTTRKKPPGTLKPADVDVHLGAPRFLEEGKRRVRGPGIVQGLAWTPLGGDVLYIEAVRAKGKGGMTLTGSLGEVMSESCRIALSYLKSAAAAYGLSVATIEESDFHVHFPAGAIKKDGPSAGIAIACALVSLLRNLRCPADLAMTGELTLAGEVLPIGGVREKVLAAQRLRLKRVVLPAENRRDVEELKPELVRGLRFTYVEEFSEVYAAVFGAVPARAAKTVAAASRPRRVIGE